MISSMITGKQKDPGNYLDYLGNNDFRELIYKTLAIRWLICSLRV